jgi:ubiquinone/menaquinone biosynthesis C-methylase UbiE
MLQTRALSALLRTFYKLLYHQFAWTYDWVAFIVSFGRGEDWVLTALAHIEDGPTLEIGHGPGHLQVALQSAGIPSVGLDMSRQMGRLAYSRLQGSGIVPALVNGCAQFLPFAGNTFKQVVATFPTEYIADPRTLTEVYRVLAPGGQLVAIPVAWITGSGLHDRLAAWLFRVTKQSPEIQSAELDERLKKPFERDGFSARVERQSLRSSQVLVIIASKPAIA